MNIPLCKAHIPSQAFENIYKVLSSGKLSGDGSFCHIAEEKLKKIFNIKNALLTSSCTHALETAMLLLEADYQDEVILPSYTFASTANSVIVAGLKPVFCDINPTTMNMDPSDVVKKITPRTKAIIPVHYAGVACDMESLLKIGNTYKLKIVEDAAHSIGATWQNVSLGTIGDMGTLSFHDTKNIVCGEGGALLTNNEELAEKALIIREKGTNRTQFLRGQIDKYTWVLRGSSYVLAEPLAAILAAELDLLEELNFKRQHIYNYYISNLNTLEKQEKFTLPHIPKNCTSNYHLFHIILNNEQNRNALMEHLRSKGIGATFHYIPLHTAPLGQTFGYKVGDLPITEDFSKRLLRLPLYPDLDEQSLQYIVEEIHNWCDKNL